MLIIYLEEVRGGETLLWSFLSSLSNIKFEQNNNVNIIKIMQSFKSFKEQFNHHTDCTWWDINQVGFGYTLQNGPPTKYLHPNKLYFITDISPRKLIYTANAQM